MNQYYESALIALDAIWSSKLRSFMTVLGNIVAVTSIIAVVSLITGLNSSVKQLILRQAGHSSRRDPITLTEREVNAFLSRHLAEAADPVTRERRVDLEQAREAIDVLLLLRDKTSGNRTEPESRLLEEIVYDLQMRFVRAAEAGRPR